MIHRRQFISLAAAAAGAAGLAPKISFAATETLAQIEQEIAAGNPIFIHVTAPWCGTCKIQKPIVAELMKQPAFKTIEKIDVDFDSQGDTLQKFKVQTQATMLVFKGGKEVDRAVGETDPEAIAALLKKIA